MHLPRPTAAAASPTNRARVTNGSALHVEFVDGRSAPARRWRDLYRSIAAELGGEAALSEPKRMLARRAASLALTAERLDAAVARGEVVDGLELVRVTGALGRVMRALGLAGIEPFDDGDPGPSLADIFGTPPA